MKKLTMVLTSRDRRDDIRRYIDSLNDQNEKIYSFLQLIFVDQGNNKDLFDSLNKDIEFVYVHNEPCSLSKARNLGLDYVSGDYICFPDDDCWYDDNTLSDVVDKLSENPNLDGIIITAKDDNNQKINSFPDSEQFVTYQNHCGALSISMFLKYDSDLRFDENIGVGSKYNLASGEETDYLLTYMEHHPEFQIWFTPSIVIRHPLAKHEGFESSIKKTYGYARGNGFIIRKHKFTWSYKIKSLVKPVIWIIIRLFTDRDKLKSTIAYTKGRYEGFFFKINNHQNE